MVHKKTYLAYRLANVAARPLTLLFLAVFASDAAASKLALAYTFGSWLMAPMSVGAFRWTIPIEMRPGANSASKNLTQTTYQATYYLSLLLFAPMVTLGSFAISQSGEVAALCAIVVVFDYTNHEQSRRLLYAGHVIEWARFNVGRNLLLSGCLIAPLLGRLIIPKIATYDVAEALSISTVVALAATLFCVAKFHARILSLNRFSAVARSSKLALRRISKYWQFSACGILAKSHQSLDKIIVAIVAPELTWVIAILGYFFAVPIMAYEMLHIATMKSKILHLSRKKMLELKYFSRNEVGLIATLLLVCTGGSIVFLQMKGLGGMAWPLVTAYGIFGLLGCLNLKWSELVFWKKGDRWGAFRIDAWSGAIAAFAAAMVIVFSGGLVAARLPGLAGLALKVYLSQRTLSKETRR